ncbi:MAG: GerMN domain-containing protein [Deltaproteobacteria bacterium]|nr:GerMN domain-containing protein [Deltaproteobacteria bacterium]MBW1956197.1 GerMN domain-containing protein [Deltaproteobacteria bacterium]MBW2042236.1 GerMN domain-containing protein [Deltaproteobacteria bacterium]MBW2132557.1 GerMN domain-containing protein [Deltaproteobacteria bacterium]
MNTSRFSIRRILFLLIAATGCGGLSGIPSAADQAPINLYFMDATRTYLKAEVRQIPESESPTAFARAVLEALLEGPREGLARAIPKGLALRAAFVTGEKTAYVDFAKNPETFAETSVLFEWLAVYSIVNSLILNLPEVETVKILMEGREVQTFSGHVDLTGSFKANMLLVR